MNKKNEVLTNLELSSFCKQMSMILKAGISPIEGISMMIEDSQNKNEKQLLEKIYEDLTMTSSLAISLKKTSVFPNYMIQMLEIGEETGKNDEEKTKKMQQLYIELYENSDAAKFFDAETKFNIILSDVNKIIGDAVMDVLK